MESNGLEEVEAELEYDAESIWTDYPDPKRDAWVTEALPIVRQIRLADRAVATGLSEQARRAIRNGHSPPRKRT